MSNRLRQIGPGRSLELLRSELGSSSADVGPAPSAETKPASRDETARLCALMDSLAGSERELAALLGLDPAAGGQRESGPRIGSGPSAAQSVADTPAAPSTPRDGGAGALTVGPYRLRRVLGEGGMGTVYEAEHCDSAERVALKVLRAGGAESAHAWRRFEREAEFLAQLDHPNVARVLATGMSRDGRGHATPWIAMELIQGRTLQRHAEEERLDHRARIGLLLQACAAVSHAHAKGIVHRDLKPDNILVDGEGRVRVLDFGVARALDEPELSVTQLTMAGDVVGTLSYMSPEQACGQPDEVDERSDVYSLGVIAFELLSGRLPHDLRGLALPDALGRLRDLDADRLVACDPGARRGLEVIVGKALEKESGRRYGSVDELAADLRRYLSHERIVARPPGLLHLLGRFTKRHLPIVAALLALVGTLAAAVVVTTQLALSESESRLLADETADRAFAREQDALRAGYRAHLAAARAAIDQGDTGAARRLLEEAALPYRGWEWRQLRSSLDESLAHWPAPAGPALDVALTRDGGSVVAASVQGIDVISLSSGEVSWRWRARDDEELTRLSEDGQRALVLQDGRAWLLHVGTDERRLLSASGTTHLAFTEDGSQIHFNVRHDEDRWEAVLADAFTGEVQVRLPMDEDPSSLCVRDGQLIRASLEGPGLEVWDVATGRREWHEGPQVVTATSSPEGRFVVSALSGSGRTVAWELDAWRPARWEDEGPDWSGVSAISFTRSGRYMAASHDDGITRLRDGETGRLIARLAQADLAGLLPPPALHEEAGLVAVADAHHSILVASLEDGRPLRRLRGHSAWIQRLAISEDGTRLASLDGEGGVRLWDLTDLRQSTILSGHESYVYGLKISPDGRRVASSAWDGTTRLWDLATGEAVATLRDAARAPYFGEVGWSPDGRLLASVHGHAVTLWDARSGEQRGSRPLRGERNFHSSLSEPVAVEWLPDGTGFLVGSVGRQVHVYRPSAEGRLETESLWPMFGEALSLSGDGRLLALSVQDHVEVWELATMRRVMVDSDPEARTRDLAFSPDDRRLAAVSDDGYLRIWTVDDGRRTVKVDAHGDQAHGLAWSPDGTRLATGGSDRVIRIWEPLRGEELSALRGHESYAYALDWSPDGKALVSASGDATVRVWSESPLGDRWAARRERERLRARLEPKIASFLDRAGSASSVAERIEHRGDWSEAERQVATDLLIELAADR